MGLWKTIKVGDLGRVITGKTPKTAIKENYGGAIPFLTPSDNMTIKYVNMTSKTLTEKGLSEVKNALLPQGTVCVSCIGSDLGKVVITTKPTVTNQQINSIVVDTKQFDISFVYYAMLILGKKLNFISKTSTAVPIINKSSFSAYEIECPPLEMQRKIASVLSAIDAKIECNQQINDNLQEQAQAIYSNMFICNASGQWTDGILSDVAEITMGQSPKGDTYNENGVGTVFFQGRGEFEFRFPTRRLFTTDPKRMAQSNDVLMSVRAPVGDLNVAYEPCCIGRGLGAIRSKDSHQSFVLYTAFSLREKLDMFNGEGTVFGSINRDALNSMPIIIPTKEEMDRFEEIVAPMDAAIRNNYEEICRLEAIRDSLLPRLMSGQLDVSNIDL